jgi:hypothetical protein
MTYKSLIFYILHHKWASSNAVLSSTDIGTGYGDEINGILSRIPQCVKEGAALPDGDEFKQLKG